MPNRYRFTDEHRRNISLALKGKHLSEETKKKISISQIGRVQTEETRKKISIGHRGKKLSREHRDKLSASHLRRYCIKGHDTFVEGRGFKSRCKKCHKEQSWRKILNQKGEKFTFIDFDAAYHSQEGKCAICNHHSSEFNRNLFVDHCHRTMQFRGLLCQRCNIRIGYLEKDGLLEKDLAYLQRSI